MIPKIIHYCWLSDDPIPHQYQEYIDEWHAIMPEYTIKKWDRNVFNLEDHPFAKAAFEAKKYAFAADYIRIYALYTEGGIYLDSDVKVIKSFDPFLKYKYFTSFENHWNESQYNLLLNKYIDNEGNRLPNKDYVLNVGLQAAIIGAESKLPYIKDMLDFYEISEFKINNGKTVFVPAPLIHAKFAEKYGFVYKDIFQLLQDNMVVFPSNYFATKGINEDENTCAIHCCAGSWVKTDGIIKQYLKRNKILMSIYLKMKIYILATIKE